MQPPLHVSRAAIDLIKRFEGLRLNAAQLEDGRWTIGYGHTLSAREGASVSESDAEALLQYDLIDVAHAVNEHVYAPLNQNQFDALCAFAFNIGVANFRRSGALRRLNEGGYLQAAASMELWRKADFEGERIVIDALVRRRATEKTLFLTPPGGWVPAPSAVLPPKVDYDVSAAVPVQTPRVVETALDQPRAVAESRDTAPAIVLPVLDDEPTATEVAAAAVTARLEALFPYEEPVAEPVAEEAVPEAPAEPGEPVFALTPPEEGDDLTGEAVTAVTVEAGEPEPDLFDAPVAVAEAPPVEPETPVESLSAEEAWTGTSHEARPSVAVLEPVTDEVTVRPIRWDGLWLSLLAIAGIAVIVVAAFYGYQHRFDTNKLSVAIGVMFLAAGVMALGTVAFFALRMLGGPDDDEEENS